MPRPIVPGEKRALNKRIVEVLANQAYTLELDESHTSRVWDYRQAAWAVEDLPQDIGLVHRTLGQKGLLKIPNMVPETAALVEKLITTLT